MAVPDYQSLMLPVLVASSKDEVRIGDVVNQLADELSLVQKSGMNYCPRASRRFSATVCIGQKLTLARQI